MFSEDLLNGWDLAHTPHASAPCLRHILVEALSCSRAGAWASPLLPIFPELWGKAGTQPAPGAQVRGWHSPTDSSHGADGPHLLRQAAAESSSSQKPS